MRNKPRGAAVFGIYIGNNLFHVVGADTSGAIVQRVRFRRDTLLSSQWLARKLISLGHTVKIIPAQFVKPRRGEECRPGRRSSPASYPRSDGQKSHSPYLPDAVILS